MKILLVRSVLVASLFALAFCGTAAAERFTERFERTYPTASSVDLVLGNANGSVSVTAWDQSAVELVAEKTVDARSPEDAREAFANLEIRIEDSPGRIEIETQGPSTSDGLFDWLFARGRNASVKYELRVPRGAELELRTVNGSVRTEGVAGRQRLHTTNGRVTVRGAAHSVDARSTNGPIEVELGTASARVEVDLATINGAIELALPGDLGAELDARTVNGTIRSELPLTRRGGESRRRLSGDLNGGGPGRVSLRTTNGSIKIRRSD